MATQNKTHLATLFLTVFLYLVGFGMMIPVLPVLGREYGASPLVVGLLMSIFSFMQFVFSPIWGRLSDRKGRRPILLLCLLGEAVSYLIFAFTRSLEMMFVARAMAGVFGGSISTASAAISDVTSESDRSKGMALIGAAFGLGFIVGPAVGGALALWGEHLRPGDAKFPMHFAAGFVSVFCLLTLAFAWLRLKETKLDKTETSKSSRWTVWSSQLRKPVAGPLITTFFLNSIAMSMMEATLILLVADRFGWGLKEVSFGFVYIGLVSTFSQGFLVRRLLPRVGERRLLRAGLVLVFMAYALIPLASAVWAMAIAMTFLSFGSSFCNPSLMGSISLASDQHEQGEALGTAQGLASLGRILGPALGGWVYGVIAPASPFVLSAFVILISWVVVLRMGVRMPNSAQVTKEST